MAVTKAQKQEILKGLIEKFGRSKSVVFTQYRGLDVNGVSALRKLLRGKEAELQVAKKTLIKLAAKDQNIEEISDDLMEGPIAVTFSYNDPLSGLQILYKFAKDNENVKLVGGIMDGKLIDAATVKKYATLPSREELLAKMMGSMQAPVTGIVSLMHNLIAGFVRVVNAYKESLPAAPVAAAPVEVAAEPIAEPVAEPVAELVTEPVAPAAPEIPAAEAPAEQA